MPDFTEFLPTPVMGVPVDVQRTDTKVGSTLASTVPSSDSVIPPIPDINISRAEGMASPTIDISQLKSTAPDLSSMLITTVGGVPRTAGKAGQAGHTFSGSHVGFRHFTFVLKDDTNGGSVSVLELNVNPEDFQIDEPYRVNAVQTAGGAFVDVWGDGIRRIAFRGNTGWRTVEMPSQKHDGYDNFMTLRDVIFRKYHKARVEGAKTHTNEELEKLVVCTLVDRLHRTAYRVIPENFKMLRNKQRPMLHMYDVSFIIVSDDKDVYEQNKENKDKDLAGLFGELANKAAELDAKNLASNNPAKKQTSKLLSTAQKIASGMQTAMKKKNEIMTDISKVSSAIHEGVSAVHNGIGAVQNFLDISAIPLEAKSILWDTKSVYTQLDSLLSEVKSGGMFTYTGHVGSTYAPVPFGMGTPPLAYTQNSFTAVQGTQESKLDSFVNAITKNSQTFSSVMNGVDVPNELRGKK